MAQGRKAQRRVRKETAKADRYWLDTCYHKEYSLSLPARLLRRGQIRSLRSTLRESQTFCRGRQLNAKRLTSPKPFRSINEAQMHCGALFQNQGRGSDARHTSVASERNPRGFGRFGDMAARKPECRLVWHRCGLPRFRKNNRGDNPRSGAL